jgi:hypothetical protein
MLRTIFFKVEDANLFEAVDKLKGLGISHVSFKIDDPKSNGVHPPKETPSKSHGNGFNKFELEEAFNRFLPALDNKDTLTLADIRIFCRMNGRSETSDQHIARRLLEHGLIKKAGRNGIHPFYRVVKNT